MKHVSNALTNHLILFGGLANKTLDKNLSYGTSGALSKNGLLILISTDLQSWDLFRKKVMFSQVFFMETKMPKECRFNESL